MTKPTPLDDALAAIDQEIAKARDGLSQVQDEVKIRTARLEGLKLAREHLVSHSGEREASPPARKLRAAPGAIERAILGALDALPAGLAQDALVAKVIASWPPPGVNPDSVRQSLRRLARRA